MNRESTVRRLSSGAAHGISHSSAGGPITRPVSLPPLSRFLTADECQALLKRAVQLGTGGGETGLQIESSWAGNLRWARNQITTSGDARDNRVVVDRSVRGAHGVVVVNQIDDTGLEAAIRRAERMMMFKPETGGAQFEEHFIKASDKMTSLDEVVGFKNAAALEASLASTVQTPEPYTRPHIFFDSTYNLDADKRANSLETFVGDAKSAGMLCAGYAEVSAHGRAVADTYGRAMYYPYTLALYSVTVRSPDDGASGWAGVDWNDWNRIDTAHLTAVALDKCLRSRNAVAVEPGRYTTILEPQAVGDLFFWFVEALDRQVAEAGSGPFAVPGPGHRSKMGQRVLDSRITVSADPMDPDLGFPPFDSRGNVYHAATWVENGILKELPYYRPYGIRVLGKNSGLPNSMACRMSGGTTSLDEMIATTKRGLVVTRFSNMASVDLNSLTVSGYTRDGLWLIENGKISKPVKNMRFVDSPLFAFNAVEQLGTPVRIFHPGAPMIVPPAKVRDFNFTSLSSAV
jgi:predicted Zn-dependent protease